MDYRVDPKGKVFTTHITKRSQAAIVCIGNLVIQGIVHLTPDNRLKDELNGNEEFIAITHAQVFQMGVEKPMFETPTLIVNKKQINWLFPKESPEPTDESAA